MLGSKQALVQHKDSLETSDACAKLVCATRYSRALSDEVLILPAAVALYGSQMHPRTRKGTMCH